MKGTMRVIDCSAADGAGELLRLRSLLGAEGQVVSERSRQLTREVFGEDLTPQQVVEKVCQAVKSEGLSALLRFTEHFDRKTLTGETIRVPATELAQARYSSLREAPEFLEVCRRIRRNILAFQSGILHRDATMRQPGKMELGLRYRPVKRAALLVPGGAAAYPSTLLMTACPAMAAGVREIVVVMPPTPFAGYHRDMLALCHDMGISEVYRVGGAQAVAAMAYGVEGIEPVDMIVGPGNLFVALAKKHVFGTVGIDCIAGPSEVVVLADADAPPAFVAAELLAQAEHSPGSAVLVTWSAPLVAAVEVELERQLGALSRESLTRDALTRYGALVLARDAGEALEIVNQLAPEHLQIAATDAVGLANRVRNAGAIFVGHHTPVALGDYAAGPSHVLPTGGSARWASGLTANDFLKRTSMIRFEPEGLRQIAPDVVALAEVEGLTAHAQSVRTRLDTLQRGQDAPNPS